MPKTVKVEKKEEKRVPENLSFVRLEPIIEIIRSSLWTGRLYDEKPVSLMLVARQESAKTECLKHFAGTSTLQYLSDLTSRGINPYRNKIENGTLRHFVLLDLVRIAAHGKGTTERTIQSLASLMEEGESTTADGGGTTDWKNFPRIGVLMAITPDYFRSRRAHWRQTGFLSRFVPVSFHYSEGTTRLIHEAIRAGHKFPEPRPEPLPIGQTIVKISEAHSRRLTERSIELGEEMQTYGFRYQRILRSLAKGHALIDGRGTVEKKDMEKVLHWSKFFTMEEVEL